jgi:hypothetical protein
VEVGEVGERRHVLRELPPAGRRQCEVSRLTT